MGVAHERPQVWCGVCTEYTDHDTSHHGTTGVTRGDIVSLGDKTGRVEEARGRRARVAWRGKMGRTETEWVDIDALSLVP